MKERVLKLDRVRAVEMLSTRKWNFYSVDRDRQIVKIEAPVSSGESWVVEVPYDDQAELNDIMKDLDERGFVEKFIPDRSIAYRKDIGGYGRSWRLTGYIDTDIWNTKAAMENLADGTARSFDRGTGEALVDCIMLDPELPEDVDRYGRLNYTVTLMEQSNP